MRTARRSHDSRGSDREIVGFAEAAGAVAVGTPVEAGPASLSPGTAYHLSVEICVVLPGGYLLTTGWLCDPGRAVSGLALVDAAGAKLPGQYAAHHGRPDILRRFELLNSVEQCGFTLIAQHGGSNPPDVRLVVDGPLGAGDMALPVEEAAADFSGLLARLAELLDCQARLCVFELAAQAGAVDGLGDLERQRLIAAWNRAAAECPSEIHDPWSATWVHADFTAQLASQGVVIVGWSNSGRNVLTAVDLVQVGAGRRHLSREWTAMGRPDVAAGLRKDGNAATSDEPGFLAAIPLTEPVSARLIYLAATLTDGRVLRCVLDPAPSPTETLTVVRLLLTRFRDDERNLVDLLDRQIGPMVEAVWRARPALPAAATALDFGAQPRDPAVSIIVPIFGRYDFIEFQIALFVDDPAMQPAELIYVIDDPSIYDRVRQFCSGIAPLYGFPFRVLYGGCNRGFAGANNLGAEAARGRKLLLMNSDVFPSGRGWLSELMRAYDALPRCGALAPKLIYEDGSIQHAGIAFIRYPAWGGLWINDHPHKGLPDDDGARPVEHPAVTAACLMIDRSLYRRVGGLSEDYIIGDFEDSDLCLKLRDAGRRNWLVPSVRLYHLERQSQARDGDAHWRNNLTLYNCWLHNRRWGDALAALDGARPPAFAETTR